MQKCGEAAAWAVYLALRNGTALKDIPYGQLRAGLQKSGCLAASEIDMGIRLDGGGIKRPIPVDLSDNKERVQKELASMKPGAAIWAYRIYRSSYYGMLKKNLDSPDPVLRKHSAIALGVAGFYDGKKEIQHMIRERDGVVLQDMRKHNQIRGVIAVSLAGKFTDSEMTQTLLEITRPEERERALYKGSGQILTSFHNTYFQFLSHSIASLIDIARDKGGKQGKEIMEAVCRNLEDGVYIRFITTCEEGSSEYEMAANLGTMARRVYAQLSNKA